MIGNKGSKSQIASAPCRSAYKHDLPRKNANVRVTPASCLLAKHYIRRCLYLPFNVCSPRKPLFPGAGPMTALPQFRTSLENEKWRTKSVSLPFYRFWDIPVTKIDLPTRQPLFPGGPALLPHAYRELPSYGFALPWPVASERGLKQKGDPPALLGRHQQFDSNGPTFLWRAILASN
jgi:hypothetical protein